MRTKENIDITTLKFDGFKANLKQAIEYASGSPFKKESKLNEACAIALGFDNSDRWANARKEAQMESASALDMAKAGICPFSGEQAGSEVANRLNASFEVSSDGEKLIVHRFPKGMRVEDQAIWASAQPKGKVEVMGVPAENFPGGRVYGEEPHLHAAIAGYREDLSNWFMSYDDSPGESSYTVAYWHSNFPEFADLPLAKRLQYETHYELVVSFMDDGESQNLSLNRIFKIGDKWNLSRDGSIDLGFYDVRTHRGADLNDPVLASLLNIVIEGAVVRPNEWVKEGGDPNSHTFKLLISQNVDGFFKRNDMMTTNIINSDSVLKFIKESLRTFEGPVMIKSRMNDPVIHPMRLD